jgi:hypothetical protein
MYLRTDCFIVKCLQDIDAEMKKIISGKTPREILSVVVFCNPTGEK